MQAAAQYSLNYGKRYFNSTVFVEQEVTTNKDLEVSVVVIAENHTDSKMVITRETTIGAQDSLIVHWYAGCTISLDTFEHHLKNFRKSNPFKQLGKRMSIDPAHNDKM